MKIFLYIKDILTLPLVTYSENKSKAGNTQRWEGIKM
jgi:hypothetical protein